MPVEQPHTAREFIRRLTDLGPEGAGDPYAGIGMGQIFKLAREFRAMRPTEIERLLESGDHPVRVGAVSIMDWQARDRKTSSERRRELFDLYIRRHDRIDTWDLVDRSAIHVVGEYLVDKPRDILHRLAQSPRPMQRRTAILSTYAFIRRGELDDTFGLAESLPGDADELVAKAVGWMLREAGKRESRPARLVPRDACRDHAAGHAPILDREARPRRSRPVPRDEASLKLGSWPPARPIPAGGCGWGCRTDRGGPYRCRRSGRSAPG